MTDPRRHVLIAKTATAEEEAECRQADEWLDEHYEELLEEHLRRGEIARFFGPLLGTLDDPWFDALAALLEALE